MLVEDARGSQMPVAASNTKVGYVYEVKDGGSFYMRVDGAVIPGYADMVNLRTGVVQSLKDTEFYPCPNCTLTVK